MIKKWKITSEDWQCTRNFTLPLLILTTPWRRKWQPTPVFLPGNSHGQRSLAGYSPQGHKESDLNGRWSMSVPGRQHSSFLHSSWQGHLSHRILSDLTPSQPCSRLACVLRSLIIAFSITGTMSSTSFLSPFIFSTSPLSFKIHPSYFSIHPLYYHNYYY